MQKDFDTWNIKKKEIEVDQKSLLFKQGDIWWCSIGLNVAQESCGKGDTFRRPVLILKKLSRELFIGIPISTKQKTGSWFCELSILGETQRALLYQVRVFSIQRLQRRLVILDNDQFKLVKEKLADLLEFSSK